MSDLNFNEMAAEPLCPANSFVVINSKVYLDVGVFVGESLGSLGDRKVTEMMVKLGRVGHAAQVTVNANRTAGNKLNCFQSPSFSPPQTGASGNITARITISCQGNLGVNADDITPMLT